MCVQARGGKQRLAAGALLCRASTFSALYSLLSSQIGICDVKRVCR